MQVQIIIIRINKIFIKINKIIINSQLQGTKNY